MEQFTDFFTHGELDEGAKPCQAYSSAVENQR
jgi:hypothetical protein